MTLPSGGVQVFGIIPAAGMSRRMGRPKQTLAYGSSTITGTVARTLLGADIDGLVVVTRTELVEALDLPTDPRVAVAINDDADSEMIDSICIGLEMLAKPYSEPQALAHAGRRPEKTPACPDAGVLVVPGDMPALSAESCRTCTAAFVADPSRIVVATYKGKHAHPIVFPFSLGPAVAKLSDGLRSLAHTYAGRVFPIEVDDPGATRDINTPEDYEPT